MKTQWTKLLVVLLAMAMIFSLAACGEKKPAETTPESTPTQSSPEAPASSNEEPAQSSPEAPASSSVEEPASSPEAPASSEPAGKESTPAATPAETPAETPSALTRPEDPTLESYTTDGEAANWVFELNKATSAVKVDGLLEEGAYYTGVYLVAEINMPASDSTFSVFFTADDTHVYVFYEFVKAEDIFWKADYSAKYHLDCVDFCFQSAGLKAAGAEFRIYAGVEGGMDAAGYVEGGAKNAGVDALYVKHTDIGYNVEFSIPLSAIHGTDDNGDKRFAFTALSTITTAWDDPAGAPTRVYTAACCAAGALDKENPSYIVIKGTKVEGEKTYETTEDGRYLITLNAAKTALADAAAVKALAEAEGTVFDGKYTDGAVTYLNDTNNYKLYVAADADTVYFYFDINDDNIYVENEATYWYRNDCAEIDIDVTGGTNVAGTQLRVWGEKEGTNHYAKDDGCKGHGGTGINNLNNAMSAGVLKSYTVTIKEGGYTVLFAINRSAITENLITMYASVALGDSTGRAYVGIDSVAKAAGNAAKPFANVFKIVDAQ